MARPIKRGTSANWLLKVRVPSDIVDKVQGHVVLPIGGRRTPVAISGGYVEVSLRTSDPDEATLRYAEAHSALLKHWEAVKAGPKPLSKRQAVAVSVDAYRERISEIDDADAVTKREAMNADFDKFSRPSLLREFRRSELLGSKALGRMLEGDFSDEEKPAYFLAFEPPPAPADAAPAKQVPSPRDADAMSIAQLFEVMREAML